jgi:TPP-dependent 2-oxoacid decarboxylase
MGCTGTYAANSSVAASCRSSRTSRRALSALIIGDGAFQMTGQEWSAILRWALKPIIFLVNNNGYTRAANELCGTFERQPRSTSQRGFDKP